MSVGVYGFYKDNVLKIIDYKKEGNPKSLGYNLFRTLYYSWPNEILGIFNMLNPVKASDKPSEEDVQKIINIFGEGSYSFNKKNLTYYDLLSELQDDIFQYFTTIRHSGLNIYLDAVDKIKKQGFCDWVYIYNLNNNNIEVWFSKKEAIEQKTFEDSYQYLNEYFIQLRSMLHNPADLGRNQFDLSGLDDAYTKSLVYLGV